MADTKSINTLIVGSQRAIGAKFVPAGKGGLALKALETSELLADPSADASRLPQLEIALGEIVSRLKWKGAPLYYSIPGHTVFARFVKLPAFDESQLDKIVEFEAQQNVPFPMNEVIWNYQVVGKTSSGEIEALLIAIKADALNDLNDVVKEAGTEPTGVDVAPSAIYNAFRHSYPEVQDPVLLMDIGSRATNLVFIDGDRVYFRNVPVGGGNITQATAKELGLPFAMAEEQKVQHGYVSLGGAYEEHSDPTIAAIARVARNTLTRLHAEIVRTTTVYRKSGGGEPVAIYLAGGGASMPYIKEFFEDKLGLPVDLFNPLRHISVDAAVASKVEPLAHCLGESVGLALRGLGTCPLEVDLVPDQVGRRREMQKKTPYLVMTAAALLAATAMGAWYFHKVGTELKDVQQQLKSRENQLSASDGLIKEQDQVLGQIRDRALQLDALVTERSAWLKLLSELNQRIKSDKLWLTSMQPMSGGAPLLGGAGPRIAGAGAGQGSGRNQGRGGGGGGGNPENASGNFCDAIFVRGLYRDDQGEVNAFLRQVAESEFFKVDPESPQNYDVTPPVAGDRHAYSFEVLLPLAKPIKL